MPQGAHALFGVMDELLLSAHGVPNPDIADEMATHTFFSLMNCNRYFVSMTATAENPVSYEYIVGNGRNPVISLYYRL